ncbi:MAG: hypothetical protein EA357_00435 [Micavibrio sp.]|nr:MAG: hypothetical protein EA357_00435 [Micavibrio sp.]
MPSYVYTETLAKMSKQELQQLYYTLLAEYRKLPEGSPARQTTGELLSRVQRILHRKAITGQAMHFS